jgi:hypothetical protein
MTWAPKYVPYLEALRIVAERVGSLKGDQINPFDLAISEGAIPAEVCSLYDGVWRQLPDAAFGRPQLSLRLTWWCRRTTTDTRSLGC